MWSIGGVFAWRSFTQIYADLGADYADFVGLGKGVWFHGILRDFKGFGLASLADFLFRASLVLEMRGRFVHRAFG